MSYASEQAEYYEEKAKYAEVGRDMREGSVVSELERLAKAVAVVGHGIDELVRTISPVLRPDDAVPSEGLSAIRQPVACEISGRIRDASEEIDRLGRRLHELSNRVGIA